MTSAVQSVEHSYNPIFITTYVPSINISTYPSVLTSISTPHKPILVPKLVLRRYSSTDPSPGDSNRPLSLPQEFPSVEYYFSHISIPSYVTCGILYIAPFIVPYTSPCHNNSSIHTFVLTGIQTTDKSGTTRKIIQTFPIQCQLWRIILIQIMLQHSQ